MNIEKARFNMVEQQIRTWEVLDQRVLDLMGRIPREDFVPDEYRNLAFADTSIPLEHGQVMMPPRVEARMIQSVELGPDDRVLEIGTGSGFVTALLASLAGHVTSVEIHDALRARAQAKLDEHGVTNVRLHTGNAAAGWPEEGPYDAIVVTGSVPVLHEHFQRQLKVGGRLFVIVGEAPAMEALLIRHAGEDEWTRESLFETVVPPLEGVSEPQRFVL